LEGHFSWLLRRTRPFRSLEAVLSAAITIAAFAGVYALAIGAIPI
jgi:hypothetical protein